jgi:hypothetical protein
MMRQRYIYYALGAGLFTPLVIMMKVGNLSHTPLTGLLVLMVVSVIPFLALIGIVFSTNLKGERLTCVFWCGLIAVWGFMIREHLNVWSSRSSTAALSLFVVPVAAFIPLAIGLLVGWGISLLFRERGLIKEKKIDREADWRL